MKRIIALVILMSAIAVPAWAATDTTGPWGVDISKPGAFTNLSSALASPITANKTLVISRPMAINNKTLPSDRRIIFVRGGSINPASGKTFNYNGQAPQAGLYQIHGGSGSIAGLSASCPEWFGSGANMFITAGNSLAANGSLLLSEASYLVTSNTGLVVATDNISIKGKGRNKSIVQFQPTAAATCIKFNKAADALTYHGEISGVGFYSTDSTYKKIAIDLVNTSDFIVSDIMVSGSTIVNGTSFWSGAGSIGLQCRGREFAQIMKLQIAADRPIVIAKNPNGGASALDNDHFHFQDIYLLGNGNPTIEVLDGVNVTNQIWDGSQAWVMGTYAFYWNDTTSSQVSYNLSINNARTEQGQDTTKHSIYINHHSGLYNLSINNTNLDLTRKGLYFRKITELAMLSVNYAGTGEALNIDSTVTQTTLQNCYWQTSATTTITGQRTLFSTPTLSGVEALAPNMILRSSSPTVSYNRTMLMDASISSPSFTVANNGVANIGDTASLPVGLLVVVSSENLPATFLVTGSQHTVVELSDTGSGYYSINKDTANSTNVYWLTDHYEIQNKRGSSVNYRVTLLGSYNSIF
jgi:hypothetical protein